MRNAGVNRIILSVLFAGILLAPSCATLTRKSAQRIPVTSSPAGAAVSVNGRQLGVTPLEIRLHRKSGSHVIRIESPGYNPLEIRAESTRSGGLFLKNFLLGLIPGAVPALWWGQAQEDKGIMGRVFLIWGLSAAAFGGIFTAIDSGGAGYELAPRELTVTLTRVDGAPRVDTILIDTDDLQSTKWIRVRRS